jgi:superfamily I DNA/RNA helicase
MSDDDLDDDLDAEQRAAVEAVEPVIAVLAGPGSGKTRTLSHRIRHLLIANPGSKALALTFTNKAAAEMKARALGVATVSSDRIRAHTFHGFGVSFLRSQGDLVGITPDFEILTKDEEKAFASSAMRGGAAFVARWGDARRRGLTVDASLAAFGDAYEKAKRADGVVDFDDLVVYPSQILKDNDDMAAAYAARFPHVLVDEFQDTNNAQFEILAAIAPHAQTVSVFADDDQAIFRFAGADRENIARFIDDLGAKRYELTCNYRCAKKIVERANRLLVADPDSSGRQMRAHNSGGIVRLRPFENVDAEAIGLAAEIADRIENDQPAHEIAVLTSGGKRVDALVAALRARHLPVTDWRDDLFQPRERRLFITALSVLRGTLKDRQARRLCEFMQIDLPDQRVTDDLLEACDGNVVAAELRTLRQLAFDAAGPVAVAEQARRAATASDPGAAAALARMVAAVADFQDYDPSFNLDDLLADLVLGAGGRPPTAGGGIKVATLHKTKGLEWPTVYMVGLEQGTMPYYKSSEEQVPDDRRVCFVGVCRAERELFLSYCERLYGYPKVPSQFLAEMELL